MGDRQPLGLDHVEVSGWFGERFDRAVKAFENLRSAIWWDCAGAWGYGLPAQWLRNMSMLAERTGEVGPEVREVAEQLIAMQSEGKLRLDYKKLPIGVWIDGDLINAFLTYHRVSRDSRALEAATQVSYCMRANHGQTSHYYSPMAIPHLLSLAEVTGDASFKDVAVKLAQDHGLTSLKLEGGAHGAAICMILSAYLDLYHTTGEQRYLDWAVQGWRAIRERMFVTGGLGEVLDFQLPPSEAMLQDETCQVSWWMILNLHMWRATGDAAYLDTAERILLNHLAFRQLHRGEGGGFCAMGDIDQGFRGDHNYFCCDGEGLFGYIRLLECIYAHDPRKRAVGVNFLLDSEARIPISDDQEVLIRQETSYPERGVVKLTIESRNRTGQQRASPKSRNIGRFALRVRIPCGSRATEVLVNGIPEAHKIEASYVTIDRVWSDGDTATIVFPIPMSIEADNTGKGLRAVSVTVNGQVREAKRLAVLYGNVVAAIFRTGHGNDLSWVWTGDYTEVLDSGGNAAEDYPGSKPDVLELEGETWSTGALPDHTTASCERSVPAIAWDAALGDKVRTRRELKVLPGLPVTIEDREEIKGWDGQGRLLCAGLRFAVVKSATTTYGNLSWPYPFPCVTTKPDISNTSHLVVQAGTYGLYERLVDGASLPKSGTVALNNGYFSAISLYDPEPVKSVTCRCDTKWVGVYLEPNPGPEAVLSRRLVFPLADVPMNATTARKVMEQSAQVKAAVVTGADGASQLELTGPVLRGAPILVAKTTGLKPGWIISSPTIASYVWDYDSDHVMLCADVPCSYRIEH